MLIGRGLRVDEVPDADWLMAFLDADWPVACLVARRGDALALE
jgi:hypothetical protein